MFIYKFYVISINFFLFINDTSIYHSYVDLLVLPFIYKSYVSFPQFMFYFTLNINLQVFLLHL